MELKHLGVFAILIVTCCNCESSFIELAELYIKGYTNNDVEVGKGECGSTNFTKRTSTFGYKSEEYKFTTKDGYILTTFRIKSSPKCTDDIRNVPVILLHGVINSGMAWVAVGPDSSVAYALSDACYDVWIINFRGTRYSREHINLTAADPHYWEFTMDDFAKYDMPAFIDKVLVVTGKPKLNVVGYSEGGAVYLALASTNDKYQNKIGVAITLEPSAYMYSKTNIFLKLFAKNYESLYKVVAGMNKVLDYDDKQTPENVLTVKCPKTLLRGSFCRFIYEVIMKNVPPATMNCLFNDFPEPMTFLTIKRYAPHFAKRIFQMINLGKKGNLQKYGVESPPKYDITKINNPVSIIYGQQEFMVTKDNLLYLNGQLNNVISVSEVDDSNWDHFSFMFSDNINSKLVPIIRDTLDNYSD